MDGPLAALKYGEIRDHAVPVMLGKGCRILPAVSHKGATLQHQRKPLPRPFQVCHRRRGRLIFHLGKMGRKLLLRIPKLRAEMNTLHHDRLLFAMVKARQAQDAAFVYAGLIPAKMGRKPFLYPAESSHVAVLYEPVGMQGLPRLYNERRL